MAVIEPGQTYSLGEDRILVLEVHPTKLAPDKSPMEGELKLIHLNDYIVRGYTHWMPTNFVPLKAPPVTVDGKELIPQKDGSVKISCGTVIPAKDADEFIRQRQEVMK